MAQARFLIRHIQVRILSIPFEGTRVRRTQNQGEQTREMIIFRLCSLHSGFFSPGERSTFPFRGRLGRSVKADLTNRTAATFRIVK